MLDGRSHLAALTAGVVMLAIVAVAAPRRLLPAARDIVAEGKRTPASELDDTLPRVRLDDWLRATVPVGTTFAWTASGCDLVPEERPEGDPICVEVLARLPNHGYLKLHVVVGNTRRGIAGPKTIGPSFVHCLGSVKEFHDVNVLSDVTSSVKAVANQSCR